MDIQATLAAAIVIACAIYAATTLAPASLRRRVAALLLRIPLLARSARLARAADVNGQCGGCGSCDHAAPSVRSIVTLHRPKTPG